MNASKPSLSIADLLKISLCAPLATAMFSVQVATANDQLQPPADSNRPTLSNCETLSLEGQWRLKLDAKGVGLVGKWFAEELKDSASVRLPGSLQEQGYGAKPSAGTRFVASVGASAIQEARFQPYAIDEEFRTPAFLTPKKHYVGAAWYERTVTIPDAWAGHLIILHLERPHWQTSVWVDGKEAGIQNSLGTPHEYDLSALLTPGDHRLTLRIDNSMIVPVGPDAHSVSDQTQTAWNGIIGAIRLERHYPAFRFEDVQVYPNVSNRSVKVTAAWVAAKSQAQEGTLRVQAESFNSAAAHRPAPLTIPLKVSEAKGQLEFEYPLGEAAQCWDEFSPALYRLTLRYECKQAATVEHQLVFGLREVGVKGTQFTVNGRPIFLRGTLECSVFPKTGYPPTDVDSWRKVLRACREHGLNHIRFHSWCPPKAAFQAADELGFYLQVECSTWCRGFGNGGPVDNWLYQESQRMLKSYGNHPSFLLMAAGNEPKGGPERARYLAKLVQHWAKLDPRRRYTGGTAWPLIPENQFQVTFEPRLERYKQLRLGDRPQTVVDYRALVAEYNKKRSPNDGVPVVSHEIASWCAYPNLEEIAKYDGFSRAGNFEIARDMLAKAGLLRLGKDFLMASGRFQARIHKAEIEAALRTPGFGGFQLLGLSDFPGQGTAPTGVLDAFWESKGYVTAAEYRRFCGPTVPLARLKGFVFTNDQEFEAAVEVAHFGPSALEARPVWALRDQKGRVVLSGELPKTTLPTGGVTPLGTVRLPLAQFSQAQKLNFEVSLQETDVANDWDIWVYPARVDVAAVEAPVHVTRVLDPEARAVLDKGGSVLLVPRPERLKSLTHGSFAPIFWNRLTFSGQKVHTVGILCDPAHPAFASFPTDSHSNWQWWELLESKSKPIVLNDLGADFEPIIRSIDDWFVCRNLGLLFEANVSSGKLMVCGMDIVDELEKRPVARQLRSSLLRYMNSEAFSPRQTLKAEAIEGLFCEPNLVERFGAKVIYASSEEKRYCPNMTGPVLIGTKENAIDGYPGTSWHSRKGVQPPHEIQIELKEPVLIAGFTFQPAEASFNWMNDSVTGRIAGYEVYISDDPKEWGDPVASGAIEDSADLQRVILATQKTGRFVRLVATGVHGKETQIAVGEFGLISAGKGNQPRKAAP